MKNLKKTLAIVLCLMMCASVLTLFTSAAETTTPTMAKTIYVSSTGDDAKDGLTDENAVKTLVKATELIGDKGGEVIILNDITIDMSTEAEPTGTAARHMYLGESDATIYIHGKKQADNSFPTVNVQMGIRTSNGNQYATCIELASPLAIYDLGIKTNGTLVFSANAFPLTIGENFDNSQCPKTIVDGGQFNATNSSLKSTNSTPVVNIMSGTYSEVYADDNNGSGHKDMKINVLGGTFEKLYCWHGGKGHSGDIVINIYGGTITKISIPGFNAAELELGVTCTMNFYGNIFDSVKTDANPNGTIEWAGNGRDGNADNGEATINKNLTGTAPTFYELAHYDWSEEEKKEPELDLDDEPIVEAPADTDAETKAPETKAPETTEADTEAEESGCGSIIGAGALVLVAVAGTAVAVGKKKEQ